MRGAACLAALGVAKMCIRDRAWKDHLRTLDEGDILLHKFSPTGFYSSAVKNPFLMSLVARSDRQIAYSKVEAGDHSVPVSYTHLYMAAALSQRVTGEKVDVEDVD